MIQAVAPVGACGGCGGRGWNQARGKMIDASGREGPPGPKVTCAVCEGTGIRPLRSDDCDGNVELRSGAT
jgi:hypothetical protein